LLVAYASWHVLGGECGLSVVDVCELVVGLLHELFLYIDPEDEAGLGSGYEEPRDPVVWQGLFRLAHLSVNCHAVHAIGAVEAHAVGLLVKVVSEFYPCPGYECVWVDRYVQFHWRHYDPVVGEHVRVDACCFEVHWQLDGEPLATVSPDLALSQRVDPADHGCLVLRDPNFSEKDVNIGPHFLAVEDVYVCAANRLWHPVVLVDGGFVKLVPELVYQALDSIGLSRNDEWQLRLGPWVPVL